VWGEGAVVAVVERPCQCVHFRLLRPRFLLRFTKKRTIPAGTLDHCDSYVWTWTYEALGSLVVPSLRLAGGGVGGAICGVLGLPADESATIPLWQVAMDRRARPW
jgi:hypothetical protein